MIIILTGGGLFIRALLSREKESLWPPLAAGALLAGLGVGLAVFRFDAWIVASSLTLGVAGLSMGLLRTGVVAWSARLLARPVVQAVLVLTAGIGLLVLGVYQIDRDVQRDINESDRVLAMMSGSIAPDLSSSVVCRTDQGRVIHLHHSKPAEGDGQKPVTEADFIRALKLEAHLIQSGPADADCNCHGWIFAAGRYWLLGRSIDTILMDNGYREVQAPRTGDVAIFRDGKGEVSHSALVRGRGADGLILLESKWGQLGRYVHTANKHAYQGHAIRYYHTDRGSHTLHGIEGSKPLEIGAEED